MAPRQTPNVNTDAKNSNKNAKISQVQGNLMTTDELRDHLESLRGISAVAAKLFALLGEQITSVSYTIPIQRGNETVKELGARAKLHRDDLKTSFDPLRAQIAEQKASFWGKNRDRLEEVARKYIEKRLQERVIAEVNKKLERYVNFLDNNEAITKRLKEAAEVSQARLKNSLLRIQYPAEPVTWISNLDLTFGQLINADEASVLKLARYLGLSPSQEEDHLNVLNAVMRHLGIGYKGIPSHTGVLFMPTKANL